MPHDASENESDWRAQLGRERIRIDEIDDTILRLLHERVACALRVGHLKGGLGLPLYAPEREKSIYQRLSGLNANGSLPDSAIVAIFREIISACREAEHPTRVAFLGPSGTNTQEAAVKYFGSAFSPLPCGTPDEVCDATSRGSSGTSTSGADYGVLAIENSLHGMVSPTLDLLANSPLHVIAEIVLPIRHCLLSNTELGRITTVYSHEQALAQCKNWLSSHLPGATLVPVTSTARGAEMASREANSAAISAKIAADIYGLRLVAEGIEDSSANTTRFFVVSSQPSAAKPTGRDKTSLAFLVPHTPGALVSVLNIFRAHELNLMMIQSRPSRQTNWEYRFFADVQGHQGDDRLRSALEDLKAHTVSVKVLGSYEEAA
jgi:chorismate mutase/prephenate dehydratase